MSSDSFKVCPSCGHKWKSRETLLSDRQVELVGYQAFYDDLGLGLFLFNHLGCGTTMALQAQVFEDLYHGSKHLQRMTDKEECPRYCADETSLEPCGNECECAFVRQVLQVVRTWEKRSAELA